LRGYLEKDDVIVTLVGTGICNASLSPSSDVVIIQNTIGIKTNEKLENKFLYYYFLHNQKFLVKLDRGSSQPSVNKNDLLDFEIEIPDIEIQKSISKILSALDAKIELNQRINAELESMAKTLYDYWFVQFEFPAPSALSGTSPKLDGSSSVQFGGGRRGYKSAGGKMVWNEALKREIPLGWEKGVLSDIGSITGGSTPSREIEDYFDVNGTAWITPKDLSLNTGNKFITKGETGVSEKGLKAASLNIMPKGTILLSSRAPIGYMAIAREEVTTNQGFKSFVPNKGYSIPYIYYTVKNAIPTIVNHSSGSTFKEVSGSVLKEIYICLPPVSITEKYKETVDAIFERQNKLELESQTLTELRDWLLPMLMNGQITVS
jgi:type I restriction enzyme S subunit